jgi:hypothetical protein
MANKLQLLPNPTNIPEAVTTGYQRQNVNIFVLQTGLDTTEPSDDSQNVIIPAGGIVELNGSLFKIISDVSLRKPYSSIAYWIAAGDNDDGTAGLSLVSRPGNWNPAKQGFYRSDGSRTLNWVSYGTSISGSVGTPMYSRTTKGTEYVYLKKGWYYIELRSGAVGGNGEIPAGGVANTYDTKVKILFLEKNYTFFIKVGGSGYSGGSGGGTGGSYSAGGESDTTFPGGSGGNGSSSGNGGSGRGNSGGGGAFGSVRPDGDANAGFCKIHKLEN